MTYKHPQCALCALDADIDPTMSNVAIGKKFGVSKDSARRHRKHMAVAVDEFFTHVPVGAISQRRTTRKLEDGSYERVTWSPSRAAVIEALAYDDVERALEGFKPPKPQKVKGDAARIVCLADWQLGKVDANGGTKGTIKRILGGVDKVAELLRTEPVAHLVLADLGDVIENFQNTRSQAQTNDLDLTTQIRTARRLLIEVIKQLAPLAPRVTFVSVPSNHCQVRAEGSKDLASTTDNDWGLELQEQIKDALDGREGFEHVKFVRPKRLEEAVTVDIGGATVGFTHGHQARGADKMGDWWRGQSHGRRSNLHNADYLLHGHHHNLRISQSGDCRWLIGTPSSDPGSTWFTNTTGESSTAGTLTFLLQDGQWRDMRIV